MHLEIWEHVVSKVTIPSGNDQSENINLSEDKLKLYLQSTRNLAIELNYFEDIQNTLNCKQAKQFNSVRQLIRKQSLNIFQLICMLFSSDWNWKERKRSNFNYTQRLHLYVFGDQQLHCCGKMVFKTDSKIPFIQIIYSFIKKKPSILPNIRPNRFELQNSRWFAAIDWSFKFVQPRFCDFT